MNLRISIILFFAFSQIFPLRAQELAIGEWNAHLPYRNCIKVVEAGRLIYCATSYALFYYNRDDNSISRLNKVNGLSDVEISSINYSNENQMLIVTYINANIDLITNDGIWNISDIKRKQIYGNKTIYRATFIGSYAYLSCGFGIVVLDLTRKEVHDTYYIGPTGNSIAVNDLAYDNTNLYAATESGILVAQRSNPNLANFAAWKKDTTLKCPNAYYSNIVTFSGKVVTSIAVNGFGNDTLYYNDGSGWKYVKPDPDHADDYHEIGVSQNLLSVCSNYNATFYNPNLTEYMTVWDYPGFPNPQSTLMDAEGYTWIADRHSGLVRYKNWASSYIKPNGPGSVSVYSMAIAGSDLWVTPGSVNSSLGPTFNTEGPSSYINSNWYALKDYNPAVDSLRDVLYVAIDPNNYKHVFVSTWGSGLAEFNTGVLSQVYSYTNSALERPYPAIWNWVGIAGIAFDPGGNLWALNSECNQLLKVRKTDGTWNSYNVSSVAAQPKATKLMIDKRGYKWMLMFGNGIIIYDDNGTIDDKTDDQLKKLSTSIGGGNLPSGSVYSLAEDLDGEIWIGTDKGIAVIYTPENLFAGGDYDAQVITIEQDGSAQHLLEFETVTAIAVDGANKKWVGTLNAGAFLFSDDGQKEIYHFTAENSPMLSNTVNAIAIDGTTGEVYFGTDKGICSFKGYATMGTEQFEGVYAYPNPVPSGYTGTIGIKGLTRNSWIKITDVTGTLVYETRSEGGQAVWTGCNFDGKKAQTGIYFVFIANEDGSEKMVTKIMLIN